MQFDFLSYSLYSKNRCATGCHMHHVDAIYKWITTIKFNVKCINREVNILFGYC